MSGGLGRTRGVEAAGRRSVKFALAAHGGTRVGGGAGSVGGRHAHSVRSAASTGMPISPERGGYVAPPGAFASRATTVPKGTTNSAHASQPRGATSSGWQHDKHSQPPPSQATTHSNARQYGGADGPRFRYRQTFRGPKLPRAAATSVGEVARDYRERQNSQNALGLAEQQQQQQQQQQQRGAVPDWQRNPGNATSQAAVLGQAEFDPHHIYFPPQSWHQKDEQRYETARSGLPGEAVAPAVQRHNLPSCRPSQHAAPMDFKGKSHHHHHHHHHHHSSARGGAPPQPHLQVEQRRVAPRRGGAGTSQLPELHTQLLSQLYPAVPGGLAESELAVSESSVFL